MKSEGNVLRHLCPSKLLERMGVENQQEGFLLFGIQNNREDTERILSAKWFLSNRLACSVSATYGNSSRHRLPRRAQPCYRVAIAAPRQEKPGTSFAEAQAKCDTHNDPDIYPVENIGCPTHEPDEAEEYTDDGE